VGEIAYPKFCAVGNLSENLVFVEKISLKTSKIKSENFISEKLMNEFNSLSNLSEIRSCLSE